MKNSLIEKWVGQINESVDSIMKNDCCQETSREEIEETGRNRSDDVLESVLISGFDKNSDSAGTVVAGLIDAMLESMDEESLQRFKEFEAYESTSQKNSDFAKKLYDSVGMVLHHRLNREQEPEA